MQQPERVRAPPPLLLFLHLLRLSPPLSLRKDTRFSTAKHPAAFGGSEPVGFETSGDEVWVLGAEVTISQEKAEELQERLLEHAKADEQLRAHLSNIRSAPLFFSFC